MISHSLLPNKDQITIFYSFQNPKQECNAHIQYTVNSGFGEVSYCSFISFLVSESNIFSISASVGISDGTTELTSYSVVRISVGSL